MLGIHDVKSVYHVPLMLEEQGIVGFLGDRLGLGLERKGNVGTDVGVGVGGLGSRKQYIKIGEEAALKGKDLKTRWKNLTVR